MKMFWRKIFVKAMDIVYRYSIRPLIFMTSAQGAHRRLMRIPAWLDRSNLTIRIFKFIHRLAYQKHETEAGGVQLPYRFILAAGLVKGKGFNSEQEALDAVAAGVNIIPGWRCVPALLGAVEFGSFTRWSRVGNPGIVVWRDQQTQSTQNRIGLTNPGVHAAATFLCKHIHQLPVCFGVNIALTPGVDDPDQQECEVVEAFSAFIERRVIPSWFTLNVSCPNTEDDPEGNQTEVLTRQLCAAAISYLCDAGLEIPLWVKISPGLSDQQISALMRVFHETGVRAVVATNTLPQPAPDGSNHVAGVGGGRLFAEALDTVNKLHQEKLKHGYAVDIIGCGGILDGETVHHYLTAGVSAMQYWSAIIYRGPLASAILESELSKDYAKHNYAQTRRRSAT
jgi:dihydroorotate dehydrogenase